MTDVYIADIESLFDNKLYQKLYLILSPERRQKTDSYKFDTDKKLSVGAELLLRYAVKKAGRDFDELEMRYGDCGKPYFHGSDLFFNISHSGKKVLVAISDKNVGCDVEKIDVPDMRIAKRFFSDAEYEYLMSLADNDRNRCFYRFWTLKESYMKALGLGFSLSMKDFSLCISDSVTVTGKYSEKGFTFREFTQTDGYAVSVCSESSGISKLNAVSFYDLQSEIK